MYQSLQPTLTEIRGFLDQGGPSMLVIAALSVITVALILWKAWRLSLLGAWAGSRAEGAVALWSQGRGREALVLVSRRGGLRARVVRAALESLVSADMSDDHAREETTRIARRELARAGRGCVRWN